MARAGVSESGREALGGWDPNSEQKHLRADAGFSEEGVMKLPQLLENCKPNLTAVLGWSCCCQGEEVLQGRSSHRKEEESPWFLSLVPLLTEPDTEVAGKAEYEFTGRRPAPAPRRRV